MKDGKFCVTECPFSKYSKDGHCLHCHESCNGCNGPRNVIAEDGCIDCDQIILDGTQQKSGSKCLKKNSSCPGKINDFWILLSLF